MRFKFCGDRDVPDWVVAEISVLSKISCVRMKLICKQVINELLGGEVGFAKVQRLIPRDKGFTPADTRAALAAMNFLLRSASVNAVSDEVLNRELQQLGLPKENSDGISRPFRNNRDLLVEYLAKSSLTLPTLASSDWRVDAVLASSELPVSEPSSCPLPSVTMRIATSHRLTEAQPLPPAKAAVLSNPARYAAERKAESALQAALDAHADVRAAAESVKAKIAVACGQSLPQVSFTMHADKYLALTAELRAALAELDSLLPASGADADADP
ncbi:hypothetical protein FNF27_02874 [Cafeteria roenbergensis]|uniref:COMM domain-containing protein n=2 Tax=Cafeteria roenbergensis TaxID=33653 RepID=A0A5A8EEU0_CAFRO|nr:hypothetical protein FNF27_02874 [Cafeteria roenbergensis]